MASTSDLVTDPFESISHTFLMQPHPGERKTWEKLRLSVRESRKLLSYLISYIPGSFTFRTCENGGDITRLYFLGVPQNCRENTILYVDIDMLNDTSALLKQEPDYTVLPWQQLLDSFQTISSPRKLFKEEQLLRERKRLGIFGISSYDFHPASSLLVFPAANNLFTCTDDDTFSQDPIIAQSINTECSGARLDPKICPTNADLVAFVHNNDLWVTNLRSGKEQRLTYVRKENVRVSENPLSAGVPSFVVQEEFDRFTGYWWQPKQRDCDIVKGDIIVYRILYEEVDESQVEIISLFAPEGDEKDIDEYRYPRAGTSNARCCLKIIEFEVGRNGQFSGSPLTKALTEPLSSQLPWMEYIVRVGWTPSLHIWAQLLDRQQRRLAIILVSLESFLPMSCELSNPMEADSQEIDSTGVMTSSNIQVLYEESSEIWVNIHDAIHFISHSTSNSEVSFIWASERTDYLHLYYVTSAIECPSSETSKSSAVESVEKMDTDRSSSVVQEYAITEGDWAVFPKAVTVDETSGLVYFLGFKDTPLETHLYVVSYNNPAEPVRLTQLGYSHTVTFNHDCSMFVAVYSSVSQTPLSTVFRIQHSAQAQDIGTVAVGTLLGPSVEQGLRIFPHCEQQNKVVKALEKNTNCPEIVSYQSEAGHTAHSLLIRPRDYQPDVKYPTVLFVYGGPQVQLVSNSFKGLKFLRLHTLACMGYVVLLVDGRGSAGRGLKFESWIKNRLGTVEIDDQVEGLKYVASHHGCIDLDRVSVHGWSYGGYLALMGLAQRPDVFKTAVAGAPVVKWTLYDSGYTERYMDLPEVNEDGYNRGSVLSYIDQFPNEENRLLIVHGLIDENVHIHHTRALTNALIKACKPYQLQIYPNERHGIRNHESSEHYETMVLSFLQQHL